MILLTVDGIRRQFDAEPVLRNVTFDVRPGERIGLIGPNGTGKTTLLNILAGKDDPDDGRVECHGSSEVGLLEQESSFGDGQTVWDVAREGLAHLYQLQADAEALASELGRSADDEAAQARLQSRYDALQLELQRLDAYNVDHRVERVLQGLGFTSEMFDRPATELSGGQQNRLLLARLLLRRPAVMLLDEPTNHLDLAATEWLEDFLVRTEQAFLLVSHDRYFLDRVTNRTLELYHGSIADYTGNFSAYWAQREERNLVIRRTYEKQQEFIAKTEDFIRRNKYGQKHAQAADRERKLERIEKVELPREIPLPPMKFADVTRAGDWVVDASEVEFGYDECLFSDLTLRLYRGERLAVYGANGCGKTTLLRVLTGQLAPQGGSVRLGTGVEVAEFDQQLRGLDPNLDAVENARPENDHSWTSGELRNLLAGFGIVGDQVFQPIGSMSGGEKSRVALSKLAAQRPNVLILDEPTNHLDLWARAALESALKSFGGTVLFVSHDRFFLDQVATRVLVFEPPRCRLYDGNYSDFLEFAKRIDAERPAVSAPSANESATATKPPKESPAKSRNKRKRRFPYRKVADLEEEIAECEGLLEQLAEQLADPDTHRDGERVKETKAAYEETEMRLAELYEHWEEAVELN